MAIKTFKRKEVKFLINIEQFLELLKVIDIYMNPDEYCVNGKEYGIYNIYYDTADSFLIKESLAKPYFKEKLRVRSYFSPAAPDDKVYIEIKRKVGGIVTKRRVSMTKNESDIYMKTGIRPDTNKYLDKQVLDEIDAFKKTYTIFPAQYISYQRMAFFGKDDRDFRLTFDRSITDRRYDLSLGDGCYGKQLIKTDQRLMEIKILDSMPLWLSETLSRLDIYKTSFSKYGKAYQNFVAEKISGEKMENEKGVSIYA